MHSGPQAPAPPSARSFSPFICECQGQDSSPDLTAPSSGCYKLLVTAGSVSSLYSKSMNLEVAILKPQCVVVYDMHHTEEREPQEAPALGGRDPRPTEGQRTETQAGSRDEDEGEEQRQSCNCPSGLGTEPGHSAKGREERAEGWAVVKLSCP